jgi:hypothetical protein
LKEGKLINIKLCFILAIFCLPSQANLLFHEDFESEYFPASFNSLCGGCIHDGKGKIKISHVNAREGKQSLSIQLHKGRTEVATRRLPLKEDLLIKWSIFIPNDFDTNHSTTISQFIGWQAPCFDGGNFHIRIDGGRWSVWMRNLGKSTRDIVLNKSVDKGQWTDLIVNANFEREDGYFELAIKDTKSLQRFTLINSGQSFIDCSLGPYIKFGLYGDHIEGSEIKLDRVSVEKIK